MAIGWLTVLKMVPWGEVIENAPKVANGAKKLWQSVGKKTVPVASGTKVQEVQGSQAPTPAVLQAQVSELQVAVADLHQQMLASSELIQSLANQNAQLIKRIEVNRVRLLWLAAWVLGLTVALVSQVY